MAGDLYVGAVYYEDASGDDGAPDIIQVTFEGGAPGTQLAHVSINTDKTPAGLSAGDLFFDTQPGALGSFGSSPLQIVSHDGFTVLGFSVVDGGEQVSFDLSGFDVGEKLVFSIDVDEIQFVDPETGNIDANAIVEGAEFQRSQLLASFVAPRFFDASGAATFWDDYDGRFGPLDQQSGNHLNLPPDAYSPGQDLSDRTAGAAVLIKQVPLPILISGTVYEDLSLNNYQDASDRGIAGVELALLKFNGTTYVSTGKTATTDSQGNYEFDGILPGQYRVVETQPTGYFSVGATPGSVRGIINGVMVTSDILSEISLLGGDNSIRNDFAEAKPVSIGGNVHAETNGNCNVDFGEPPIAGVTIELLNAAGVVVSSVKTDAQGNYRFQNLPPGVYTIRELQPAGYYDDDEHVGSAGGVISADDLISQVVLGSGVSAVNYDFCELLPASLAGVVFADANGTCTQEATEPPIAGVKIDLLDAAGKIVGTTTTDASGRYRFDNLAPGQYGVREEQPQGYFDGDENVGSEGGLVAGDDLITQVMLGSGVNAVNYNFCELLPASLSGHVYVDLNDNGALDPQEPPIANVTIDLLDGKGNVIRTTVTNANGDYVFNNLPPGEYGIRENQPLGYFDGGENIGSEGGLVVGNDLISQIILGPGINAARYNFGELLPASLTGVVFADANGTCTQEATEPPIAGVKIDLLDAAGKIVGTTTTDASGRYRFDNLAPGQYGVREEQPQGYFDGDENVGSEGGLVAGDDLITQVMLGSGVNAVNYNFCELLPASLSGHVYVDLNDNGALDPQEPPIANVTIDLLDGKGNVIRTTVTDANGDYVFNNLPPGEYGIRENQPLGYFDGGENIGSEGGLVVGDDLMSQIILGPGINAARYNFGELLPASISGVVYVDLNNDCENNQGDSPIAGVLIRLLDSDGNTVSVTITDANGEYAFAGLKPDTYRVAEEQPAKFFNGCSDAGSEGGTEGDDIISDVALGSDRHGINYNFGELPPGSITGYAFQDGPPIQVQPGESPNIAALRDGKLTSDDTRLAGVVLELRNGVTGEPILGAAALLGIYAPTNPIRTLTDAAGYFQFVGLPAGNYAVFEVQPTGYIDSLDTPGSLGGIAINPSQIIPQFVLQSLAETVSLNDDAILRIALFPGQTSVDNLFSEVLTTPPQLIPPPPPDQPPPVVLLPLIFVPPPKFSPSLASLQTFLPEELLGGSSAVLSYTWHLSVINAGTPRAAMGDEAIVELANLRPDETPWEDVNMEQSEWTLGTSSSATHRAEARRLVFGMLGAIPVTGDFNGDGITDVGMYKDGHWYLDVNGNGVWDEGDLYALLGTRNDKPVTGDWDGDGKTDIGIYGPAWAGDPRAIAAEGGIPDPNNMYVNMEKNVPPPPHEAALGVRSLKRNDGNKLRADLIDHVFHYGTPTDIPIIGDWNGDGIDTIAVFSKGTWYRDLSGEGQWSDADVVADHGQTGDIPVVGDFNGDGIKELGIYRNGAWYLDTNGNHRIDSGDQVVKLGGSGDVPVVGDWDGDGRDEVGVYHNRQVSRAGARR